MLVIEVTGRTTADPTGSGTSLGSHVVRDAARDGVGPRWAWGVLLFPAVLTAALGLAFLLDRPSFYVVQLEDRPIEWGQFAACLFVCLVAALTAATLHRAGRRGAALLLAVVALGSLVLAGEEISWAQRVIGIATPAELETWNNQSELNAHNIRVGVDLESVFKAGQFAVGLFAAGLALLTRPDGAPGRGGVWDLVAPPLFTLPGFAAMSAYRIVDPVLDLAPLSAFQEAVELMLYVSLAATVCCVYARSRRLAGATSPGPEGTRRRHRAQPRIRVVPPLATVGVAVVAVTVLCAVLTARSGVLPGNLPLIDPRG